MKLTNIDSILSQIVRSFISHGRLLITGPLQNSLKKLFARLNWKYLWGNPFEDFERNRIGVVLEQALEGGAMEGQLELVSVSPPKAMSPLLCPQIGL
jgi:hypothetical protein